MSRYIALFFLLVLGVGLFWTWFFISSRKAETNAVQVQADEVQRRFVIAREIASGERDQADYPWYDTETMGADAKDGEVRNAIRNDLRQGSARAMPPTARSAGQ